jgi:hypothetical protein
MAMEKKHHGVQVIFGSMRLMQVLHKEEPALLLYHVVGVGCTHYPE